MDKGCEEQAFVKNFPNCQFGSDASRRTRLTPKKYFNARILNKDGTFAENVEYLFYAQYITEYKQMMDDVLIAVQKSFLSSPSGQTSDEKYSDLSVCKAKAYHFLQTVRGYPPYWQKAMYKLFAVVKQFGTFTFFATLSLAYLSDGHTAGHC